MTRPSTFQHPYIAIRNTPYLASAGGHNSGGVLAKGQVVWMGEVAIHCKAPQTVIVFVDGLGIVSLDPRSLFQTEIGRHLRSS